MCKNPVNGFDESTRVHGLWRVVYIVLATLFFIIGMLGVVLPVLPTTPFLLLMSYFLIRSSPWLYKRFIRLAIIGTPIRDWSEKRSVRRHVKIVAYVMVLGVVVMTLLSTHIGLLIKVSTLFLVAVGIVVIWRLPVLD